MTPDITPFLFAADRERPELKQINTAMSCFQLLALTLAKAGPEWAFVGKTERMDGGKVTPPGFAPVDMTLTRNDGAVETVRIVGVSMDSAWHVPSRTQVKVIANSSANDDPDLSIHGPARLTPYPIDPMVYRWHNPPITQSLVSGGAMPSPVPVRPATILDKGAAFAALKELDAFYRAKDGLDRADGIGGDMEAIAQWFYQLVIEGKSIEDVKAQIRTSDEWRSKHSA